MTPEQKHRLYIDELNYYFHELKCYGTIMEIMDDKYDLMFLEKIYNLLFLDIIDYHCGNPEYLAYKGLYYQNKKIDSLAKKYYIEAIEQENVLAMYLLGMFSEGKKKDYYLNMVHEYETRLGVSYKLNENTHWYTHVYQSLLPSLNPHSDRGQYLQKEFHPECPTTIKEIFDCINNITHYVCNEDTYCYNFYKEKVVGQMSVVVAFNGHRENRGYTLNSHGVFYDLHDQGKKVTDELARKQHLFLHNTVFDSLINHKDILQTTNLIKKYDRVPIYQNHNKYISIWDGLPKINSSCNSFVYHYVSGENPHYRYTMGPSQSYTIEGISHLDKKVAYIDALISHGYRNLKKLTPERPRLIELANEGNIEAMILLNEPKYLEKAVELGSVHAMLQLGNWYRENTEDVKLINKYYRMAIDMGDEEALLYLSNPVIDYDKIIEDNKKLKQMVDDLMRINDALERTVETYHYKFTR